MLIFHGHVQAANARTYLLQGYIDASMPPKAAPQLHVKAGKKSSNDATVRISAWNKNTSNTHLPSMYQGATTSVARASELLPPNFPTCNGTDFQHRHTSSYIQSDNRNTPPNDCGKDLQPQHHSWNHCPVPTSSSSSIDALVGANSSALDFDELAKLEISSTGRKGDSRMNRAVAAKKKFPNISLDEALSIGGFKFPTPDGSLTAKQVFDEDNRSLSQRKNQLNRRLRYGHKSKKKYHLHHPSRTKKRDRSGSGDASSACSSDGDCYDNECSNSSRRITSLAGKDATKTSTVQAHAYKANKPPDDECEGVKEEPVPPTQRNKQRRSIERRDSFLDQIMEIPCLDELPDSFVHGAPC